MPLEKGTTVPLTDEIYQAMPEHLRYEAPSFSMGDDAIPTETTHAEIVDIVGEFAFLRKPNSHPFPVPRAVVEAVVSEDSSSRTL